MQKNLLLIMLLMAGFNLMAQIPTAKPVQPDKQIVKAPAPELRHYFCCQMCTYTAKIARKCPVHQISLVRVGDWYCPVDSKSFTSEGKCPMHKKSLVQMQMKYQEVTPKPSDMKKSEPK